MCAMCERVFDFMGDQKNKYRYKFSFPEDKLPKAAIEAPEFANLIVGGTDRHIDPKDPTRRLYQTCRTCYHKPIDHIRNPDSVGPPPHFIKNLTINE